MREDYSFLRPRPLIWPRKRSSNTFVSKMFLDVLLVTTLTLLSSFQISSASNIVKEFSDEFAWMDNDIPQFNSLTIDKNTGN